MTREATAAGFDPERLRETRRARGISQRQLAEDIGTDRPTIAKYETGERTPYVERLAALAAALGVAPSDLSRPLTGTFAELRARVGLSQQATASRAGLVRTTYAAIERGEIATLDPDTASRVAAALGVDPKIINTAHAISRASYLDRRSR